MFFHAFESGFRNLHVPQKTQLSRIDFFEHLEKTYVSEIDFLPIFLLIFCRFFADFFADFLPIFLSGTETDILLIFLPIFLLQLKHNKNNCSRRATD